MPEPLNRFAGYPPVPLNTVLCLANDANAHDEGHYAHLLPVHMLTLVVVMPVAIAVAVDLSVLAAGAVFAVHLSHSCSSGTGHWPSWHLCQRR